MKRFLYTVKMTEVSLALMTSVLGLMANDEAPCVSLESVHLSQCLKRVVA